MRNFQSLNNNKAGGKYKLLTPEFLQFLKCQLQVLW
jgi:hypothetical protein